MEEELRRVHALEGDDEERDGNEAESDREVEDEEEEELRRLEDLGGGRGGRILITDLIHYNNVRPSKTHHYRAHNRDIRTGCSTLWIISGSN